MQKMPNCQKNAKTEDFSICKNELNAHNLPKYFGYNIEDFEQKSQNCKIKPLPFCISRAFFEQMENLYKNGKLKDFEALKKQIIPDIAEFSIKPYEISDPLGAKHFQITKRLVHKYKIRCLLLSTGLCFANCRHCFRRASNVKKMPFINAEEIEKVCQYLSRARTRERSRSRPVKRQ